MKTLNAVIVDDERLARRELRTLLSEFDHISIIGEADSVDSAEIVVKTHRPDIVFLDIQLMGETGFTFLNRFEKPDFKVIFVTAYDEYAIRAFDVNAMGYLLKPVNPAHLKRTLERLDEVSQEEPKKPVRMRYNDLLFCKSNQSFHCFRIDSVQSIHAEGDYSRFCTFDRKQHMILKPLKHWEACLPGEFFQRIHRSMIVNLEYIQKIESNPNSGLLVYLRNNDQPYTVSRTYTTALRKAIRAD